MKCSSRRNCNQGAHQDGVALGDASMKCSSRRNCNEAGVLWLVTTKGLNEVQLPKELQPCGRVPRLTRRLGLNEVQLPKELQRSVRSGSIRTPGLNEVQLPKELQQVPQGPPPDTSGASMKCSSRRNCNGSDGRVVLRRGRASMKCSSRRNCNASRSYPSAAREEPQ